MTESDGPSASWIVDRANRAYRDEVWEPIALRPDGFSTTRHDDIARLIRRERGKVLDVGCGAGQLALALADRFDALSGVDISEVRIRLANSVLAERFPQYRAKVAFQCVSPSAPLPFPDGSFDVVITSAVLEAVPDVFVALDEIARVCRPGGCLVAAVANACYVKNVLGMLAGRVPLTWSKSPEMAHRRTYGWDGGSLRYFSKGALGDLLRYTGFAPEEWSANGVLAKLRRWYPNLCGGLAVRARRNG
jgi:SAM-dependent methyltransferase